MPTKVQIFSFFFVGCKTFQRYVFHLENHQQTLDAQYLLHPERFVKAPPKVAMPEEHVYINPIISENGEIEQETGVNFPTLKRGKRV